MAIHINVENHPIVLGMPTLITSGYENASICAGVTIRRRNNSDRSFTLAAGEIGDVNVLDVQGNSTLTINGTWAAASITGTQTGTAGTGTNTTTCVQPNSGAVNWVANALRGKFLRITSGDGSGAIRPIESNTTTAITVHAITGMDSTSVFAISTCGTSLGTVTIDRSNMMVALVACEIDRLVVSDSTKFSVTACDFATSSVSGTGVFSRVNYGLIDSCTIRGAADLNFTGGFYDARCINSVFSTGSIGFTGGQNVLIDAYAHGHAATPIAITAAQYVRAGINSNSNGANGFSATGCNYFVGYGNGLVGTGNTGYGAVLSTGNYDLTGATITGTQGDFTAGDVEDTWANLISSESIVQRGTAIYVV